jgi:hypothetical protein
LPRFVVDRGKPDRFVGILLVSAGQDSASGITGSNRLDTNEDTNIVLTDTKVRGIKPKEKPFKISDGAGLYLLVQPSGSKLWRMAYRFQGRQKTAAFGIYPDVSLSKSWPHQRRLHMPDLECDHVDSG